MFRIAAILTFLVYADPSALAQSIVRPGQPLGVIPAPVLSLPGSPLPQITFRQPARMPVVVNPLPNYWWYATRPGWYDEPPVAFNNAIPLPAAAPLLPAPIELRARLTLNLAASARVWLAGKEVDAAATPVILESPVLRDGQAYSFDVKVTWRELGRTEERARIVRVDAGESKSLTYFGGK